VSKTYLKQAIFVCVVIQQLEDVLYPIILYCVRFPSIPAIGRMKYEIGLGLHLGDSCQN